jgi:hypothetical protein
VSILGCKFSGVTNIIFFSFNGNWVLLEEIIEVKPMRYP